MDADALANCTCLDLGKAARAVTKMYDEALNPSGLRATQFSLITTIKNNGPSGVTELAEVLVTDRTTLTKTLKPLLKFRLFEVVEADDRRQHLISITSKGRDALDQTLPMWHTVQMRMVENLGLDRWEILLDDLSETVQQVYNG